MQAEEIKALIESQLADCQAQVQVDGSHIALAIVSPDFEGLTKVKRQMKVNSILFDAITSGAIHAIDRIEARAPSEV